MKKLPAAILIGGVLLGNDLPLSQEKSDLPEYKRHKIQEDIDRGKTSLIAPLTLSASITKNRDSSDTQSEVKKAGISLSQDVFRSGGIYYTIEQASALGEANLLGVDIQESSYLQQIYTLKAVKTGTEL